LNESKLSDMKATTFEQKKEKMSKEEREEAGGGLIGIFEGRKKLPRPSRWSTEGRTFGEQEHEGGRKKKKETVP